jgi:hypothetical protein
MFLIFSIDVFHFMPSSIQITPLITRSIQITPLITPSIQITPLISSNYPGNFDHEMKYLNRKNQKHFCNNIYFTALYVMNVMLVLRATSLVRGHCVVCHSCHS